jgi:sarcosine oxidase subunit beta
MGDRVTAVVTAEGEHIAVGEGALLLTNAHVPGFVREELGVTLPVWSMLPQVLLTEPLDSPLVSHLIGHERRTLAIKPVPGGQVMISGGWHGHWDAQADQGKVIPEQVAGNLAEAVAVYPGLAGVRLAESDASRPESACVDDIPIIDRLPGAANLIVGTGWSGHGFAIAPAVAKLLADWVTGSDRPELLRPFAYDRFLA